jgi:WD40 repeat protein
VNWAYVGNEYNLQIETYDEQHGKYIDGVEISAKIISKGGELRHDFGEVTTKDGIYKNSIIIPSMDWYAENILSVTAEYYGVEKTIEKEFEVFKNKGDTSASYGAAAGDCALGKRVSVSGEEAGAQGLWFSKTGEKMFLTGYSGDDVNEYTLTGAYCIGTKSFVDSFDVSSQAGAPADLAFNPSGDIMYVLQAAGSEVYEYKLSVPWDVSTASYTDSFDLSTEDDQPRGIEFSKSGKIMFILGSGGDEVNQYDLSVAWDVSTASASCHPCFEISEDDELEGLAFSKAGDKMFVQGYGNDNVYEYTLSVPWDVSSASLVYTFDIPTGGGHQQARDIIFDTSGKTMFILEDYPTDRINPYKLSVAWDLSSASKLW